jgi:hypothetical protein
MENTLGTWGTYQNRMGTHWELKGNIVGTHWQPGKNEKKILPAPKISSTPLPQNLKGKKQGTTSACLGLPTGCMKFLFPKEFITNFGLDYLISLAKITPPINYCMNWGYLFCFILISLRCLTSPTFFFCNEPI